MSVKLELLRIQQADREHILRPEEVVQWAKDNPESALYGCLEWNNRKAAEQHRLWQVRQLIQLHVLTEDRSPMLVSLSIDRKNRGGGYRSISDVIEVPDLREIMLADALAELERVQMKYERVDALRALWEEAERVRQSAGVARKRKSRSTVAA